MKKNKFTGWLCVGTNGLPFSTIACTRAESIGRYEIYETRSQALKNAHLGMVRKVTITVSTEEESQ